MKMCYSLTGCSIPICDITRDMREITGVSNQSILDLLFQDIQEAI